MPLKQLFTKCAIERFRCHFHASQQLWLQSVFSENQQKKILQFLNQAKSGHTSKYKLPASFQRILDFRERSGPIVDLNDLLEIKGLTTKSVVSMCNLILNQSDKLSSSNPKDGKDDVNYYDEKVTSCSHNLKVDVQKYFYPQILQCPQRFAAVNVLSNSISWAVLEQRETWNAQNLCQWDCFEIPGVSEKMTNLTEVVHAVRKVLPQEKVYVFIDQSSRNFTSRIEYSSSRQFTASLHGILVAICCSNNNTMGGVGNSIFYVRGAYPARLFHMIVGNEVVSAQSVITDLLMGNPVLTSNETSFGRKLQEVNFGPELADRYLLLNNIQKENLSKSLLLAKTFVEYILCSSHQKL